MSHIFISYSHSDWGYADSLAGTLRGLGFDVWFDERLNVGEEWPQAIQQNLAEAGAVVVIMSPAAQASAWVQKEVAYALKSQKPVFPLLLEGDAPLSSLSRKHYEDVREWQMPGNAFYDALWKILPAERQLKKTETQAITRIADYLGRVNATGALQIIDWDTTRSAFVQPLKRNRVVVSFSVSEYIEGKKVMDRVYRQREYIESMGWSIADDLPEELEIEVERILQNRGDEENLAREIVGIFRRVFDVNAAVLEVDWNPPK